MSGHNDAPIANDRAPVEQVGALCWRPVSGKVQVLLVTSLDTGRWITPKGWPMAGKSAAASAMIEAWEEAGVRGEVSETSLGTFTYLKRRPHKGDVLAQVEVFPLEVAEIAASFPEAGKRMRQWLSLEDACQLVSDPGLCTLLNDFKEYKMVCEAPQW